MNLERSTSSQFYASFILAIVWVAVNTGSWNARCGARIHPGWDTTSRTPCTHSLTHSFRPRAKLVSPIVAVEAEEAGEWGGECLCCSRCHSGLTAPGSMVQSWAQLTVCVEFLCMFLLSPQFGFLQVLRFPPTSQFAPRSGNPSRVYSSRMYSVPGIQTKRRICRTKKMSRMLKHLKGAARMNANRKFAWQNSQSTYMPMERKLFV